MRSVGREGKYLVTASSDETLQLLRTKDWSVSRSFKGHKGRVNDVAVHPKGRIALSVGQDRTLRMWDLLGSSGQAAGGGKQGSSSTKLGAGTLLSLLDDLNADVSHRGRCCALE